MKPQVYKGTEPQGIKPIKLAISEGSDSTYIIAVDEDGDRIACLLEFHDGIVVATECAKKRLEEEGYDTSFCRWGGRGDMLIS